VRANAQTRSAIARAVHLARATASSSWRSNYETQRRAMTDPAYGLIKTEMKSRRLSPHKCERSVDLGIKGSGIHGCLLSAPHMLAGRGKSSEMRAHLAQAGSHSDRLAFGPCRLALAAGGRARRRALNQMNSRGRILWPRRILALSVEKRSPLNVGSWEISGHDADIAKATFMTRS
jgi:hypothetical protein